MQVHFLILGSLCLRAYFPSIVLQKICKDMVKLIDFGIVETFKHQKVILFLSIG